MDISQISHVSEEPVGLATGECRTFIDSLLMLSHADLLLLSVLLQYLWYYIFLFLFPCASLSPAHRISIFSSSWRCCDVLLPYSSHALTSKSHLTTRHTTDVSLYEWDNTSKIGNVYLYHCCLTINITLPSSTLTKIHSWHWNFLCIFCTQCLQQCVTTWFHSEWIACELCIFWDNIKAGVVIIWSLVYSN